MIILPVHASPRIMGWRVGRGKLMGEGVMRMIGGEPRVRGATQMTGGKVDKFKGLFRWLALKSSHRNRSLNE